MQSSRQHIVTIQLTINNFSAVHVSGVEINFLVSMAFPDNCVKQRCKDFVWFAVSCYDPGCALPRFPWVVYTDLNSLVKGETAGSCQIPVQIFNIGETNEDKYFSTKSIFIGVRLNLPHCPNATYDKVWTFTVTLFRAIVNKHAIGLELSMTVTIMTINILQFGLSFISFNKMFVLAK